MAAAAAVTASKSRLLDLTRVSVLLLWSIRMRGGLRRTRSQTWSPRSTPSCSQTLDSHLTTVQLQCSLFSTTFNPQQQRLGNKVLRQRLKGPQLAAYYPRKSLTIEDINKEFAKFDLETWNEYEEDRLEGLQIAKLRGKGAPKKKRVADRKSLQQLQWQH